MVIFHVFVKEPNSCMEIDNMEEEQDQLVGDEKPAFIQKSPADWFKTPLFYKVQADGKEEK